MNPDIVYLVRPGENNEELKWSLRSLTNLPHGRVFMAGHTPAWVRNVTPILVEQVSGKHLNTLTNLIAAVWHPGLSKNFILFNDDFYVMAPLTRLPVLHRGPLDAVLKAYVARYPQSVYTYNMLRTKELLTEWGIADPLSYELHCPMQFNVAKLKAVLRKAKITGPSNFRLQYRTLYGNLYKLGGEKKRDFKPVETIRWAPGDIFASSEDDGFRRMRNQLALTIPKDSPYVR